MKSDVSQKRSLLTIFFGMLTISCCTFGGGFVIAGFIKKKFVDQLHWLNEEEMLDYVAIAQSCPGAIAVNTAVLAGRAAAGTPGLFAALFGMILPPMVILSVISVFYNAFSSNKQFTLLLQGMQAGVAAVILDVVLDLGTKVVKSRDAYRIVIMILAFAAVRFLKVDVIVVVLCALGIGAVKAIYEALRKGGKA